MTLDPTETPTKATDQDYTSWNLPDVTSTVVLSSAEKEARERKDRRFRKPKKTGPVDTAAGESIEIVETIEETFKPLTAEQLQAITEAAKKEGYDAGYEKGIETGCVEGEKRGLATGLENGDIKVAERVERVERVIEALLIPLQTERKKLEVLMVDMICQLTEAVVLREIEIDSSQVIKLVDDALSAVPTGSDKFSLYLAEQDIALVESHLNDQSDKQFKYYSDESILPGGCRLETKNSTVSNTVEQRLKKVIDDFTHKRIAASDDQIEVAKKILDESVPHNTIEDVVENSASKSELKSMPNVDQGSEPYSETQSELSSEPNTRITDEDNAANRSSKNSSEEGNNDKIIESTIEKTEQETTEFMSPLESEKQKKEAYTSQDNQQDSYNDSQQQGPHDAPI
jgi:flagellar assembly protein FliH